MADTLNFTICNKPSEFPPFAWATLRNHEVNSNVILPILDKCWKLEQKGSMPKDHLWAVVYTPGPRYEVKLILACTDGLTGKYPLFIFTPVPSAAMKNDSSLISLLSFAARHLLTHVPTQRIYSVFGRELLSRTFTEVWSKLTKIPPIADPYYHCKISHLTPTALAKNWVDLPASIVSKVRIRPAEPADVEAVSRLCHAFAATSPPFILTEEGARAETKNLITNRFVWVLDYAPYGVTSLVAFTRNSEKVATITKVYTDEARRGKRLAELLLRAVCHYLLHDCAKEKVALFVGTTNDAANVYQRVGFVGVGRGAVEDADIWSEIAFDRSHVELGHW